MTYNFDVFVIFPINSGYWVKLSQIHLIKTQKIIAYLVANFMRISKLVLDFQRYKYFFFKLTSQKTSKIPTFIENAIKPPIFDR